MSREETLHGVGLRDGPDAETTTWGFSGNCKIISLRVLKMNNLHETMRTMTKKSQKGILNIEEQDTNSENPFQGTQRLDGAEGGNQSN